MRPDERDAAYLWGMCLGVRESVDSCWFLVLAVIIYLRMHLTRNRYQVALLPLKRSLAIGYMENRKIGS
jgi:hypothetical protein